MMSKYVKELDFLGEDPEEDKPLFSKEEIEDYEPTIEEIKLEALQVPPKLVVEWYETPNQKPILTSKGKVNLNFLKFLAKRATQNDLKWLNLNEIHGNKGKDIIRDAIIEDKMSKEEINEFAETLAEGIEELVQDSEELDKLREELKKNSDLLQRYMDKNGELVRENRELRSNSKQAYFEELYNKYKELLGGMWEIMNNKMIWRLDFVICDKCGEGTSKSIEEETEEQDKITEDDEYLVLKVKEALQK